MTDAESANTPSPGEPSEPLDDIDDAGSESRDDIDDAASEPVDGGDAPPRQRHGRVLSAYGVVSAALGVVSVAAVVVCVILWSGHRSDADERGYQTRAKKAAAEWAQVLTNMNKDNLEASLRRLHEDTAGGLNAGFDAAVQPYRDLVQRLGSQSASRVESVAIAAVQHDLGDPAGTSSPAPAAAPAAVGTRTDTVQVVATSVIGDPGGKPQTVNWNLLVDVSDVHGTLLISGLKALR